MNSRKVIHEPFYIIDDYQLNPSCPENVVSSGLKCPVSPNALTLTPPFGLMVKYMRLQLKVHSLSHASGGSCIARMRK